MLARFQRKNLKIVVRYQSLCYPHVPNLDYHSYRFISYGMRTNKRVHESSHLDVLDVLGIDYLHNLFPILLPQNGHKSTLQLHYSIHLYDLQFLPDIWNLHVLGSTECAYSCLTDSWHVFWAESPVILHQV